MHPVFSFCISGVQHLCYEIVSFESCFEPVLDSPWGNIALHLFDQDCIFYKARDKPDLVGCCNSLNSMLHTSRPLMAIQEAGWHREEVNSVSDTIGTCDLIKSC
jgi:hypothetical protein